MVAIHYPEVHNLGPAAIHDHACNICWVEKAVLNLNLGVFEPCWGCQTKGWKLKQVVRPRFLRRTR